MIKQRLVVGISGSSGAVLGIRLLQALRSGPIETHLIVTPSARLTIKHETGWSVEGVQELASAHYDPQDLTAPVASGSFDALGMVVIPCSIKSLSAIANSYSADLLTRAADVSLKEGRPLLLVVREAPLHAGHIDLMQQAARSGAILFPPVPAFYTHPQTVDEIVDNIVGRVLRRIGIANDLYRKWGETDTQAPAGFPSLAGGGSPGEEAGLQGKGAEEIWTLPVMTLATVGDDGAPLTAAVYFAADEERRNLYFFSAQDSPPRLDPDRNSRAAASIHPIMGPWPEIRGLKLRGTIHTVLPGEEWERAWARYLVKFPFVEAFKDFTGIHTLYRFRPD